MSTPVGHVLGSFVAFELCRKIALKGIALPKGTMLAVVVCALLADADHVAILIAPQLETFIHGPTHSILFCIILAALIATIVKSLRPDIHALRLWFVFFACSLMHPIQDYMMGVGPGIQYFWPLTSQGWLSPVALLPTSYYSRSASGYLSLLLSPPIIQAITLEIAVFVPLLLLPGEPSSRRKGILLLLSLCALIAVAVIHRPIKAYWDLRGAAMQQEMIRRRVEQLRQSNNRLENIDANAPNSQP